MEETLTLALESLFGKAKKKTTSTEEKTPSDLILDAQVYYDLIEESMKEGDWTGIGSNFNKLGLVLEELSE